MIGESSWGQATQGDPLPPGQPELVPTGGAPSLWEQGRAYARAHQKDLEREAADETLGKRYGESLVRGKMDRCANNPNACIKSYLNRRADTDRPLSDVTRAKARLRELLQWQQRAKQEKIVKKLRKSLKRLQTRIHLGLEQNAQSLMAERREELLHEERKLDMLPPGRAPTEAQEVIRLEEMSQEYAMEALDEKIREKLIDPASLNARILHELALTETPDPSLEAFANRVPEGPSPLDVLVKQGSLEMKDVRTIKQVMAATREEMATFVEKRFVTKREADVILEYAERYAIDFVHAFDRRLRADLPRQLFEAVRDNARKVAYQTKVDKRTLSGSDHGVRHIYQGNTAFAEQIIASAAKAGADLKPRDAVLIRQIIIDHDLGYTTPAAQTKEGAGAAKDHPCVGCKYVETNAAYYRDKFGEHGYEVMRDVLLNHSYPSSRYDGKRPKTSEKRPFTYNRPLIRSVVSTVDSLGVTAETKAMDLFRHPETIEVLQNARIHLDAHGGTMEAEHLEAFKADLRDAIDRLEGAGRVSAERAAAYRLAVERKFDVKVIKKTIGQYAGIVRTVRLTRNAKNELAPEIRMDVSRLQALVAGAFGEEASLAGFNKALESFGFRTKDMDELGKIVAKLRREKDGYKRQKLLERLTFTTERATFVIGDEETLGFRDERAEEFAALQGSFAALAETSPRQERRDLFRQLLRTEPPREHELVERTIKRLASLIDRDEPAQEQRFTQLSSLLRENADDTDGVEAIEEEFRRLLSKDERARVKGPRGRSASQPLTNG